MSHIAHTPFGSPQFPLPFDGPPDARYVAGRMVGLAFSAGSTVPDDLRELYASDVSPLPPVERMKVLLAVADMLQEAHADRRPVDSAGGCDAMMPFLAHDMSPQIVGTAALESAAQMPLVGGNPATGSIVVRSVAREKSGWRRGAIMRGLIALGDQQSVAVAAGCWREMDDEGRAELARRACDVPTNAMINFYLRWLADAVGTGDEASVGQLAGLLARMPADGGVIVRLSRAFPGWSVEPDRVVEITATWTFQEAAELVAPRLDPIAAREAPPKVVPEVLRTWRAHRVH